MLKLFHTTGKSILSFCVQLLSFQFLDNIQKNVYDKRDLERFRLEDEYVCCFLRHQQGSVEKASEMVDVSLRWRKELEVNGNFIHVQAHQDWELGVILFSVFRHVWEFNNTVFLHSLPRP